MKINDHAEIGLDEATDCADQKSVELIARGSGEGQEGTGVNGQAHEVEAGRPDRLPLRQVEAETRA